jgi:hypothetical protein
LAHGVELYTAALIFRRKIHDSREHGADDYPKKLIPVEERHANPIGFCFIVKGGPEYGDELDKKEEIPPAPPAPLLAWSVHRPLPTRAAVPYTPKRVVEAANRNAQSILRD